MKSVYPVIFTQVKDCVLVEVPDLEILTEGKDLPNAIDMARDAIGLKGITLEDKKLPINPPSDINSIQLSNSTFANDGESCISLVDIDFTQYRKMVDNRTVRKNVTLPSWLNFEAEKANVNFSRVLQDALMNQLGVKPH